MSTFFPSEKLRVCISRADDPVETEGRRTFFNYRDLGVDLATDGMARATLISSNGQRMERETGWHYHECDLQIGFIIRGWSDLELEDGTSFRMKAGDLLMLPGGVRHNELAAAEDLEVLEFSIPANMGTVPCEPPSPLPTAGDEPAKERVDARP
jgi:mannose-6-phosphate isomerase-like protein (cupin superfamily)